MRKPIGKIKNKSLARNMRRRLSIRKTVIGTSDKPRVNVKRTNKHLVVQVIDDGAEKTLFSCQTFGKSAVAGAKANKDGAKAIGAQVASKLKENKIESAVFDRGGLRYHGVIAAVAEGIRENGIQL